MVEMQFKRAPGMEEAFGAAGVSKSIRDAESNLQFLSVAIGTGDKTSFGSYLIWLDGVLASAGLPQAVLDGHLDCMMETLASALDTESRVLAVTYIKAGCHALAAHRGQGAT
jgi:hypothetical protein